MKSQAECIVRNESFNLHKCRLSQDIDEKMEHDLDMNAVMAAELVVSSKNNAFTMNCLSRGITRRVYRQNLVMTFLAEFQSPRPSSSHA